MARTPSTSTTSAPALRPGSWRPASPARSGQDSAAPWGLAGSDAARTTADGPAGPRAPAPRAPGPRRAPASPNAGRAPAPGRDPAPGPAQSEPPGSGVSHSGIAGADASGSGRLKARSRSTAPVVANWAA